MDTLFGYSERTKLHSGVPQSGLCCAHEASKVPCSLPESLKTERVKSKRSGANCANQGSRADNAQEPGEQLPEPTAKWVNCWACSLPRGTWSQSKSAVFKVVAFCFIFSPLTLCVQCAFQWYQNEHTKSNSYRAGSVWTERKLQRFDVCSATTRYSSNNFGPLGVQLRQNNSWPF